MGPNTQETVIAREIAGSEGTGQDGPGFNPFELGHTTVCLPVR